MDFEKILNELLADLDLANEGAWGEALGRCLEYVEKNLREPAECTAFLEAASARLGVPAGDAVVDPPWDGMLEGLIAPFDLTKDLERKKAYARCVDYATEHLNQSEEFNSFLVTAARRVGVALGVRNLVKNVEELNGDEQLYLYYVKDEGPILVGNRTGLQYLGAAMTKLAHAKLIGQHSHWLPGEAPFVRQSYPFTLYLMDERWFEENAPGSPDEAPDQEPKIQKRDVDPNQVRAILFVGETPAQLLLTRHKLYRVSAQRPFRNDKVWSRPIRQSTDRLHVFEITRDDGQKAEIALDLDDHWVLFLAGCHLNQFLYGELQA